MLEKKSVQEIVTSEVELSWVVWHEDMFIFTLSKRPKFFVRQVKFVSPFIWESGNSFLGELNFAMSFQIAKVFVIS